MGFRLLASITLAFLLTLGQATTPARAESIAIAEIAVAQVPKEARDTLALIKKGGPFRYRQDGTVFGNRERRLPLRGRGYYREYTVPTPGIGDRGARRIVAGAGAGDDVRTSGEYYYTDDHYNSVRRIKE